MQNFIYILLTEILMTPLIVYFLYYTSVFFDHLNTKKIALIMLILSMMSGMLNSINFYILFPKTFLDEVMAINISMFEMSVILSYILLSAFNGNLKRMTKTHSKWISILIGWNEISMAILLYSFAYGFGTEGVYLNIINLFGAGITNYLFTIPMIIEMVFLFSLKLHRGLSGRILVSIILMQASDPGLFGGQYSLYLTGIFALVMVFSLYYTLTFINSERDKLEPGWAKNFRYFVFFIFLSAIGLISSAFIPGEFGVRWIIFSLSMGYSTIYYFLIALRYFDPGTPEGIRRKTMEANNEL